MRFGFVLLALFALAACEQGPGARAVTPEGIQPIAFAGQEARERAEAVGLAQSGVPKAERTLAYVYQEPGVTLVDETVSVDGGAPFPLKVNQYHIWDLDPGPHLVEAWRSGQRIGSRAITLRPGDTVYLKYAVKNNLGGLLYLVPAGMEEGRMFVRSSNFAGQWAR